MLERASSEYKVRNFVILANQENCNKGLMFDEFHAGNRILRERSLELGKTVAFSSWHT
jgi:hypothetical protein